MVKRFELNHGFEFVVLGRCEFLEDKVFYKFVTFLVGCVASLVERAYTGADADAVELVCLECVDDILHAAMPARIFLE